MAPTEARTGDPGLIWGEAVLEGILLIVAALLAFYATYLSNHELEAQREWYAQASARLSAISEADVRGALSSAFAAVLSTLGAVRNPRGRRTSMLIWLALVAATLASNSLVTGSLNVPDYAAAQSYLRDLSAGVAPEALGLPELQKLLPPESPPESLAQHAPMTAGLVHWVARLPSAVFRLLAVVVAALVPALTFAATARWAHRWLARSEELTVGGSLVTLISSGAAATMLWYANLLWMLGGPILIMGALELSLNGQGLATAILAGLASLIALVVTVVFIATWSLFTVWPPVVATTSVSPLLVLMLANILDIMARAHPPMGRVLAAAMLRLGASNGGPAKLAAASLGVASAALFLGRKLLEQ